MGLVCSHGARQVRARQSPSREIWKRPPMHFMLTATNPNQPGFAKKHGLGNSEVSRATAQATYCSPAERNTFVLGAYLAPAQFRLIMISLPPSASCWQAADTRTLRLLSAPQQTIITRLHSKRTAPLFLVSCSHLALKAFLKQKPSQGS